MEIRAKIFVNGTPDEIRREFGINNFNPSSIDKMEEEMDKMIGGKGSRIETWSKTSGTAAKNDGTDKEFIEFHCWIIPKKLKKLHDPN